jgi:hypothetical protein
MTNQEDVCKFVVISKPSDDEATRLFSSNPLDAFYKLKTSCGHIQLLESLDGHVQDCPFCEKPIKVVPND